MADARSIPSRVRAPYGFLPGEGELRLAGLVGHLFRVTSVDPNQPCGFFKGRLKVGDLVVCTKHLGDYIQQYMFVLVMPHRRPGVDGILHAFHHQTFGSYGPHGMARLGLLSALQMDRLTDDDRYLVFEAELDFCHDEITVASRVFDEEEATNG